MTRQRQKQEGKRLFAIYEHVQGSEVQTWRVKAEHGPAAGLIALRSLGIQVVRIKELKEESNVVSR